MEIIELKLRLKVLEEVEEHKVGSTLHLQHHQQPLLNSGVYYPRQVIIGTHCPTFHLHDIATATPSVWKAPLSPSTAHTHTQAFPNFPLLLTWPQSAHC